MHAPPMPPGSVFSYMASPLASLRRSVKSVSWWRSPLFLTPVQLLPFPPGWTSLIHRKTSLYRSCLHFFLAALAHAIFLLELLSLRIPWVTSIQAQMLRMFLGGFWPFNHDMI